MLCHIESNRDIESRYYSVQPGHLTLFETLMLKSLRKQTQNFQSGSNSPPPFLFLLICNLIRSDSDLVSSQKNQASGLPGTSLKVFGGGGGWWWVVVVGVGVVV
jgi:hypothetical protein